MAFCTECGASSAAVVCPDCLVVYTGVVPRTLDTIALIFGALMAVRVILAVLALGNWIFVDPTILMIAFVAPVGLAIIVYYFSRKARIGDADALRWLKVVFALIGGLALIGVGTVLSPLITIAFCAISFVVICIEPFANAFNALARANAKI